MTATVEVALAAETHVRRSAGRRRPVLTMVVMVALVPLAWAGLAATGRLGPGFIGPWPAVDTLIQQWDVIWYNAAPTIGSAVAGALIRVGPTRAVCGSVVQHGRGELGALYQASRLRWWRNVGFWRCIPALDLGLRTMFPACFVGAIVAEWSGAVGDVGLGGLMANAAVTCQGPVAW